MQNVKEWYYKSDTDEVYGPADVDELIAWVKDGRIEPTGFLSKDRETWTPAPKMQELEMKWIVETELGVLYGPFNHDVVSKLIEQKVVPPTARIYRLYDGTQEGGAIAVRENVRRRVFDHRGAFAARGPLGGADAQQLAALEAAAQRELAAAKKFGININLGGKR